MTIEGLFFDLDGTLLDTAEDFVITVNQILADYQQPHMPAELIRRHVSAGSRTLMQMAFSLPEGEALEQRRSEFLGYYDRHIRNAQRPSSARLYPGMEALLSAIEERHITWGIITNKPRAYAEILLDQLGLTERSATLLCPEDVSRAKPDPESLLLACQQTGCTPGNSVYIGDHLRDIQAGRAAGMFTVAALYGYIKEDDNPQQWQANLNINNANELHHWLKSTHWTI